MLKDYYAKISRNIVNTPYYKDSTLLKAWMGLILSVRFQPTVIDGIEVNINEALFLKAELQEVFGVDKRRAYTILKRMERDGLITWINIRNKYTLIKVAEEDFSSLNKKKAVRERHLCENRTDNSEKSEEAFSPASEKNKTGIDYPKTDKADERTGCFYTYPSESGDKYSRTDTLKEERKEAASEEKTVKEYRFSYGEFNNVLLTRAEYNSLTNKIPDARLFIEKLSSYLVSHPEKKYPNHYAVLVSWYADHMIKHYKTKAYKPANESAPTASYDIKRAEQRARAHVATVKKKNKETGLWESKNHNSTDL